MIDIDVLNKLSEKTACSREILERLEGFGYIVNMGDTLILKLLCEKVENHIKNLCNISTIPEGLKTVYVDMVCGDFLNEKYKLNQLGDCFDVDEAITSVSMGDVSVSYDKNSSNSSKIQALIDELKNSRIGDLVCYRKIRW